MATTTRRSLAAQYEYAYALAVSDYRELHGDPVQWRPWEVEYYPHYLKRRTAQILEAATAADATDPESYPATLGGAA